MTFAVTPSKSLPEYLCMTYTIAAVNSQLLYVKVTKGFIIFAIAFPTQTYQVHINHWNLSTFAIYH